METESSEMQAAGRALDEVIARRVTKLRIQEAHFARRDVDFTKYFTDEAWRAIREYRTAPIATPIPRYSTEVSAAWEVIAYFHGLGWSPMVVGITDGTWRAEFLGPDCNGYGSAYADTMPHAVCLAALEASAFVSST